MDSVSRTHRRGGSSTVTFRLERGGAIIGRVLDHEGDPLVRRSLVVPIATTPAKGARGRWSVDFDVTLAPL